MTLQYNIQYKSILYRINVQYGIILCTIQLYNTVQFYVQYSCTLKYVLFGIVHYTVLQYQTIFDYNTKQFWITIPNNTLYCIVFGIVWYWLHYCTLSALPPLCALPQPLPLELLFTPCFARCARALRCTVDSIVNPLVMNQPIVNPN